MVEHTQKILLVEDDQAFRMVYCQLLQEIHCDVVEADERNSAWETFSSGDFPVVLLDLMLPPDGSVQGGLQQLQEMLKLKPNTKVIVVSGAGDMNAIMDAMHAGAYDFLTKPVEPNVLLIVVQRALARARLERQVLQLQNSLQHHNPEGTIIGQNPDLQLAMTLATRVAPTDLPVLITGEHGTGKELFANLIHQRSQRAKGPFVVVNCGALAEGLLESTLFGHVKGAFTGATRDHKGLFAEANGGTIFLDEIGDMPLYTQVKILRVLETGDIMPVGASRPYKVDVRCISATNRDLAQLLREGLFREDLYWRIKGTQLQLPPLRERPGDLPLLAAHFLNLSAPLCTDGIPRLLSDTAKKALLTHTWPGNFRELRHEMQRATVMVGPRRILEPEDFTWVQAGGSYPDAVEPLTLQEKLEALERKELKAALALCNGNRTHAAKQLGLSRQGLLKKMQRYKIQ